MRRPGLVLLIVFGCALLGARGASAGVQDTLTIGSLTMYVGEEGAVDVRALGLPSPGLGAWTVHVTWNASVVEVTQCGAREGGVCSTTFGSETGILTGANEHGIEGDTTLGSFSFQCLRAGTSPLTLETTVFADATTDSPQDMHPTLQHGTIACAAGPTDNGGGTLSIDSRSAEVGEQARVDVAAADVGGIGAWTIDVLYDSAFVTLIDCTGHEATICLNAYAPDTLRIRGASAEGLEGDFRLATLTFRCDARGTSAVSLDASVWADAHVAEISQYTPPPAIENGSIACGTEASAATPTIALPAVGGAANKSDTSWPVAALALLGAFAMIAGAAVARRFR